MLGPQPKFDKPPVVETVLSAQFARLPKFRTAHAGCFWKSSLGKEWATIEEGPRLDDLFERFGDERIWGQMGLRFSPFESQRTQIINSDSTRMIQIQDSRFIYNWKKGVDGIYPSYKTTREEFGEYYGKFKAFLKASELGEVEENQWEVSYMNPLVKGELWNSPSDWQTIFPWLNRPHMLLEPDSFQSVWDLVIPENRGRLHAKLYYGRISLKGPEALVLDMTARGPASNNPGLSVADGFELGHDAIVCSFAAMTSKFAQEFWQRKA